VTAIRNSDGVSNEESQDAAIYVCRSPAQGWRAAWPRIKHLSS
jgi:hypothetical protein